MGNSIGRRKIFRRPPFFFHNTGIAISNPQQLKQHLSVEESISLLEEEKILTLTEEIYCTCCMEKPVQTRLSCGHETMCYSCAYKWIIANNHRSCPICRCDTKDVSVCYQLKFILPPKHDDVDNDIANANAYDIANANAYDNNNPYNVSDGFVSISLEN